MNEVFWFFFSKKNRFLPCLPSSKLAAMRVLALLLLLAACAPQIVPGSPECAGR
jgi:hypothetical protein